MAGNDSVDSSGSIATRAPLVFNREAGLGRLFDRLALFATVFAFVVIVLGAYVRLSDAGLGCPDWPGCYGHLDVPAEPHEVARANQAFPERPVETHKAWKEMIHRYFAGTLGLLILALAVLAILLRRRPGQPVILPLVTLGVVVLQALLGMWTVTIRLNPTIVMLHLIGGFTTLSLLWWMVLSRPSGLLPRLPAAVGGRLRGLALAGLLLVVGQIMLGGWTSANYAALHCPDFPTCQGRWWPPMDFREAFVLWRGTEIDFEGGVLDNDARVAIHVTHRLGALTVTVFLLGLFALLRRQHSSPPLRRFAWVLLAALILQVSLGISNVLFSLPLAVAVAHNGGGALLLLVLVTLNHLLFHRSRDRA